MRELTVAFLVFASGLCQLQAGIVPGRWEKVDALPSGHHVVVKLKSGDKIEGPLLRSNPMSIVLGRGPAKELKLPKSEIARIKSREPSADRLTDGLWKGLLTGAAVSMPILIWGLAYQGGEREDAVRIGTTFTALSLGVGGGIGVAVDATHKSQALLYRAPK